MNAIGTKKKKKKKKKKTTANHQITTLSNITRRSDHVWHPTQPIRQPPTSPARPQPSHPERGRAPRTLSSTSSSRRPMSSGSAVRALLESTRWRTPSMRVTVGKATKPIETTDTTCHPKREAVGKGGVPM